MQYKNQIPQKIKCNNCGAVMELRGKLVYQCACGHVLMSSVALTNLDKEFQKLCPICDNTGYIIVLINSDEGAHSVGYRCLCFQGSLLSEIIPLFPIGFENKNTQNFSTRRDAMLLAQIKDKENDNE